MSRRVAFLLYTAGYLTLALGSFIVAFASSRLYPGVAFWFERDQLDHASTYMVAGITHYVWPHGDVPYLDYPFELPFVTGLVSWLVNTFAEQPQYNYAYNFTVGCPTQCSTKMFVAPITAAIYFSGLLMSLSLAGVILLYYRAHVSLVRVVPYLALLPAVIFQGDVSTELLQGLLFVAGLFAFEGDRWIPGSKRREGVAALLLALAAGTKLLPILTFPLFYSAANAKRRFTLIYAGVLAAGFGFQFLANWSNTLAVLHFEASYGVEGSWLGLLFPHSVIDYATSQTWFIHSGGGGPLISSVISRVKPVYAVSAAITLAAVFAVWRLTGKRFTLVEKCFLVFVAEVWGLWVSPPQFFFNVAVLAPLVLPVRARTISAYWAVAFLETPVLWAAVASHLGVNPAQPGWMPNLGWILLGAAAQWGLVLLTLDVFSPRIKRGIRGLLQPDATTLELGERAYPTTLKGEAHRPD